MCLAKCLVSGKDSQLVAVFIKDAHLRYANLQVDSQVLNRLHPHDRLCGATEGFRG